MKYMLLIHQGDAPTPYSPEDWARLSEDEQQAVYADYKAINETPGVSPGLQMQPPETATTVRVQDGKTLTTDGPFVTVKEALGGFLVFEADDLDAAIELAARARRRAWAGRSRCAHSWSTSHPRAGLPRRVGARPRDPGRSRSPPSAGLATAPPPTRAPGS